MYLIELYSTLIDNSYFDDFQRVLQEVICGDVHEFIAAPQLLLEPWKHQHDAFEAWLRHDSMGSIEMATATGKTLIGMMAIAKLIQETSDEVHVRIISHSKAILNQWRREIIEKLGIPDNPNLDYHTSIGSDRLNISFHTVQGVHRQYVYNFQKYSCDLAIFDEVHHEAARTYRYALQIDAKQKMGLSATIPRIREKRIEGYLGGPIVFRYSFDTALSDGIIPKFDWKMHISQLSFDEDNEYKTISKQIVKRFNYVINDVETIQEITGKRDIQINNLGDFIGLIQLASFKGVSLPQNWKILQTQLLRRRWIIHRSKPKISDAVELAKRYGSMKKTILFTMDIDTCEEIAEQFKNDDIPVFLVHSRLKDPLSQLDAYKRVENGVLIGARMLEEGINIPDAEIGINVSSSKTQLQLVQRMGRILRYQEGKKPVFHHFVTVPIHTFEGEDEVKMLDDISWVQDTALKMGITAEFEELNKIQIQAENKIQDRFTYEQKGIIPRLGTFRLDNVLSGISEDSIEAIIKYLRKYDPEYVISDTDWNQIIRSAHGLSEHEPFDLPGHWWVLIFGKRNPQEIISLLSKRRKIG